MYCPKCGTQLPDDAAFCYKCGFQIQANSGTSQSSSTAQSSQKTSSAGPIIAAQGVTSFKCPNCGAPLSPKFGEMVITCEYCGSAVALGAQGWTNIQKQSMLPVKIATTDQLNQIITPMMDKGLLHRHLQENSTQEEMNLSYVPYWIVSVAARTQIIATNEALQLGQTATQAALLGVILGGMGGGG